MVQAAEAEMFLSVFLRGSRRQDYRGGQSESLQISWRERQIHPERRSRVEIVVDCWAICFVATAAVAVRPSSTLEALHTLKAG